MYYSLAQEDFNTYKKACIADQSESSGDRILMKMYNSLVKKFIPISSYLLALIFPLLLVSLATPIKRIALAQDSEEVVSFHSDITVNKSGIFNVEERITYNFSNAKRHGIIRDVQTVFKNNQGKRSETSIRVTEVTSEEGRSYPYSSYKSGDNLEIKIGDPNYTVTGIQKYVIRYEAGGAMEEFSDHTEIYWNVTGNGWEVRILKASATIRLPREVPADSLKARCFTGRYASSNTNCSYEILGNTINYKSLVTLLNGEGISISLSLPKGYITPLPKKAVSDYSVLIAIGVALWYAVLPLIVFLIYLKFGRDPRVNSAIPALFDPPLDGKRRITPGEAGTIIDESADNSDVTATIVDLAIRGYFKITENGLKGHTGLFDSLMSKINKDYTFIRSDDFKTKDKQNYLLPHEEKLLEAVFGKADKKSNTKLLKSSFYEDSQKIKDFLYDNLVHNGFFQSNPNRVRRVWMMIGIAVFVLTGNIPLGLTCILLSKAMPRKTLKGAKTKIDILGLKKFLTSQERQLEFQEKNWYLFEKLLPYAIAFGVTETWAKRFGDLGQMPTQSDWYVGSSAFNTLNFMYAIVSFNSFVGSVSTPTTSSRGFTSSFSSGGGFSGGGFGGGGGGRSW